MSSVEHGLAAGDADGSSTAVRLVQQNGATNADRSLEIYASVQNAIVEQRLPPGTRLSEDQLGRLFSVSRTLVRGALQALAKDGMVVLARHKGATVASPSVEEARALFDARRVIEACTVSRAAAGANGDDIRALHDLLESGRDALIRRDRGRAIRLSGAFHIAIARIGRQPILTGFLEELISRSSLVIALYGHSGRADCGDDEHRAVVEAIQNRDGDSAARLMSEHLLHIEDDLDFERQSRPMAALADVFQSFSADTDPGL